MAVSDDRQRIMPTAEDRRRGEPLDYPEAVLLTNPSETFLKGEVSCLIVLLYLQISKCQLAVITVE